MRELITWMIKKYEDVLPTLNNMVLHSAYLGFKWAVLDERELRGLESYKTQIEGILGPIDDVTFVHPQYYVSAEIKNYSIIEKWSLYDLLTDDKVGDIWISLIEGALEEVAVLSFYF